MESSDPPSASLYLVLLLVLLLCSMFFSASEIAFLSASRLRIRYLREKKNRAAARVERLLARKEFFLNTILIGNNVVNIAASALLTALAVRLFGDAGVGIATAVATVVILIFGEILPKSAALMRPERIALTFSLPLSLLVLAATPLVALFSLVTGIFSRILGVRKEARGGTVTEEDIKTLIEVGEEEGLLEPGERAMMHRILAYTDMTARDIMVPRTDIVAISVDTPRHEILALSRSSRFSRFPVYRESVDDIIGVLYIKDFLFDEGAEGDDFPVRRLLRPALFAFEGQRMADLQNRFRADGLNFAVVIDEYGGTAGIVTTEDLVEEIFGGIRDEFDRKPESPEAGMGERTGSGGKSDAGRIDHIPAEPFSVSGSERLADLGPRIGLVLESGFFDTVGGFMMERTGIIPPEGTSVSEQGWKFTVTATTGNRIDTVRLEPPAHEADSEARESGKAGPGEAER